MTDIAHPHDEARPATPPPSPPRDDLAILGWEQIHSRLCVTEYKGAMVQLWSMREIQACADELERAGAIVRKVLMVPDSTGRVVRRRMVIAWPARFLEAMKILTVKKREARAMAHEKQSPAEAGP